MENHARHGSGTVTSKQYRWGILGHLIIAVTLRLVHVLSLDYLPVSDMAGYLGNAAALGTGTDAVKYTTLFPPGYMWFLWLAGRIFDLSTQTPILILQCMMSGVTLLAIAEIARICFDKRAALIATGIYTLYGFAIKSCGVVMSEALGEMFFAVTLMLTLYVMVWKRWWMLLALVVSASLAIHVRVNTLPIAALIPLTLLLGISRSRGGKSRFVNGLAMALCFVIGTAASLIPWSLRNSKITGKTEFISTNGPMNLLQANNAYTGGGWFELGEVNDIRFQNALKSTDPDAEFMILAKEFMRAHVAYEIFFLIPEHFRQLYLEKQTFWPWDQDHVSNYSSHPFGPKLWIPLLPFYPILSLGLIGFLLKGRRSRGRLLPAAWLVILLPILIVPPVTRYHYPSDFLLIIAGAGILARVIPISRLSYDLRRLWLAYLVVCTLLTIVQVTRFSRELPLAEKSENVTSLAKAMISDVAIVDTLTTTATPILQPLMEFPVSASETSHLLATADICVVTTQTAGITPYIRWTMHDDDGTTLGVPGYANALLPVRVVLAQDEEKFYKMWRIVLVPGAAKTMRISYQQDYPGIVRIRNFKISGPAWSNP